MSLYLIPFPRCHSRSRTDILRVETQKVMLASFQFSSGMTWLWQHQWLQELCSGQAHGPSFYSFPDGISTVIWVTVMVWTVVMSPSTMPKLSCMNLTGTVVSSGNIVDNRLTCHTSHSSLPSQTWGHKQKGKRWWHLSPHPSSGPQTSPWWWRY